MVAVMPVKKGKGRVCVITLPPDEILDILEPYEQLLYYTLHRFAKQDRKTGYCTCYPSLRTLANKAGVSINTVRKARKGLKEKGLIKWYEEREGNEVIRTIYIWPISPDDIGVSPDDTKLYTNLTSNADAIKGYSNYKEKDSYISPDDPRIKQQAEMRKKACSDQITAAWQIVRDMYECTLAYNPNEKTERRALVEVYDKWEPIIGFDAFILELKEAYEWLYINHDKNERKVLAYFIKNWFNCDIFQKNHAAEIEAYERKEVKEQAIYTYTNDTV